MVSEGYDRKLGVRERVSLRWHLWICDNCRRFVRQLEFMRGIVRSGMRHGQLPIEKPLPPERRQRILDTLRKRAGPQDHEHQ